MEKLKIISTEPILQEQSNTEKYWNNLNLYERSAMFKEAQEYLEVEDLTEEEFDIIAESESLLQEKIVACGYVAKKYDNAAEIILSEAQALKDQAKALETRARVFSNVADRRREAMKRAMFDNNIKKVVTPLLTVGLRKKPIRLLETTQVDLEKVDPVFVRIRKEFNRNEIKQYLKDGHTLEGFKLSETEFSITIK